MSLIVRARRVVLPDAQRPASIHIESGTIVRVGPYDEVSAGAEILDAGDLVVRANALDDAARDVDRRRAFAVRQNNAGAADQYFRVQRSEFRFISEFKSLQSI